MLPINDYHDPGGIQIVCIENMEEKIDLQHATFVLEINPLTPEGSPFDINIVWR